jgi:ArsR family transcriptional regulator
MDEYIDVRQYIHMPVMELLPVIDVTACCSPLVRSVLPAREADDLARSLKVLADPARLRIISMVAAHADGEACVCDLTEPLGLSQPTVSHHLKVLVDNGFLTRSKRGTWAYFRLVPGALDSVAALLVSA